MPFAFSEQGVAMLSSILNSEKAIQVNIVIVRTFVMMRQYALNFTELQKRIASLEKKHSKDFKEVSKALQYLLQEKITEENFKNRQRIGFK